MIVLPDCLISSPESPEVPCRAAGGGGGSTPDAARVTVRPPAPAPLPTPAALRHPIAAAAVAAGKPASAPSLNGFTYICLPPPNICLLAVRAAASASSR